MLKPTLCQKRTIHTFWSLVPTRLTYDTNTPPNLLGWGFLSGDNTLNTRVEEWFKLSFGKDNVNQRPVEALFGDYLCRLYGAISHAYPRLCSGDRTWEDASIKFVFSVPTTWGADVVKTFEKLIRGAGFGMCKPHHLTVGLTEPHAVAVFELFQKSSSLRNIFKEEKPVIFVDAGGGTTDICLMKQVSNGTGDRTLKELYPTTVGEQIGSTYIDSGFQNLLEEILEPIKHFLDDSVEETAKGMRLITSVFEETKCAFGEHEMAELYFPVECGGRSIPDSSRFNNNRLVVTKHDIQALFDQQIEALRKHIVLLISNLNISLETPVHDILLSGGLGSSLYVQRKLANHPSLRNLNLHVSTKPRFAVCIGLVHYSLQKNLISESCASASFGVVCRIRSNHQLQHPWGAIQQQANDEKRDVLHDRFHQKWYDNCIAWFVQRGQTVTRGDLLTYKFSSTFDPDIPRNDRTCRVKIVTTKKEKKPAFTNSAGVRTHNYLLVDLSKVETNEVQKKNMKWHKKLVGKKAHVKIDFLIEAKLGLFEASFRCLDTQRKALLSNEVNVHADLKEGFYPLEPVSKGWIQVAE